MDDPQLILQRVPIGFSPRLDGKVSVIDVRDFENLRTVVEVQIGLLGGDAIEMGGFDFGKHVGKDAGIWFECHDASIEVDGEPSFVHVHVRRGGKDEREFEQLVKVASDEGVSVDVNGGLDTDRVEGPNA